MIQSDEQRRLLEEEYRIVCSQSNHYYLIYEFETNKIQPKFDLNGVLGIPDSAFDRLPESLFAYDLVIPQERNAWLSFFRRVRAGEAAVQADIILQLADGSRAPYRIVSTTIRDGDGKPWHAVIALGKKYRRNFVASVDRRSRELRRLARIAAQDSLTKALNRTAIERQITEILQNASSQETFALFMIDLDNFKQVNDKLGHQQGDRTLTNVVGAIRSVFRSTDIIGRLGGDEFVVFLSGKASVNVVRKKAAALVEALQLNVGGAGGVDLSASVGVVIVSGGDANFDMLYRQADQALYTAKRAGKNRSHVVWANASGPPEEPASIHGTVRFQTLLHYMDSGVVLLEVASRIRLLYASPGYSKLFGCEKPDLSDGGHCLFEQVLPQYRAGIEAALRQCARSGHAAEASFRARYGQNASRWFRVKAMRIPYEDSEFPVLVAVTADITELREQQAALRESGERTRIAIDRASQTLWEVDIRKRTFAVFDLDTQTYDPQTCLEGVPGSLIDAGIAHPSSKAAFARFIDDLLSGKPEDSAAFILRYFRTGIYGWARLSYHTLFDEDGLPAKAIGISREMPAVFNEQTRFAQEQMLFDVLRGSDMELVVANLTKDLVRSARGCADAGKEGDSYSGFVGQYVDAAYSQEDALRCRQLLPQALADAYAAGTTWVEAEYRCRSERGNVHWVVCIANLIAEPATRELYAFLIRRNVDGRKQRELSLPSRVERDGVSHLYARETAEEMVASLIAKQAGSDSLCALAVIDIDGLTLIRESQGREVADRVRFSIGRLLRIFLGSEGVVGQLTEERLLVFWPEVPGEEQVKSRLETVILNVQKVREASSMLERIAFTAGIAELQCSRADYTGLYRSAAYVCEQHSGSCHDVVAAFEGFAGDAGQRGAACDAPPGSAAVIGEKGLGPLPAADPEALHARTETMMSDESFGSAMTGLMERLGERYSAEGLDALTGLPDSTSFAQAVSGVNVDAVLSLGVLYADINGLSLINQEKGYEYGNAMLLFAAGTFLRVFGQENAFRVSGDEFAVLYKDVTYAAFTDKCAQAQSALDKQYPRRFSIGYTWADKDYAPGTLADHARSIMNYNKQSYCRAAESSGTRSEARSLIELKEAIAQGRYTVYLQPKTRLATDEVVGGEALARYLDPLRGVVSPSEFVRRMEEDHVIRELDFFMLDRTLSIMQQWKDRGKKLMPISVNFSRQTLLDRSALATILAIHSRYDIPAEYIEIELTETLGEMERQTIADAVEGIRQHGFKLSLDDFGSAYSSITMLSDIPFDSVKLDKSIIHNFVDNRISRSIVESMVSICSVMGAMCIAEGVETAEQAAALKEAGCRYAQGYYYNKPLPANQFEQKYVS